MQSDLDPGRDTSGLRVLADPGGFTVTHGFNRTDTRGFCVRFTGLAEAQRYANRIAELHSLCSALPDGQYDAIVQSVVRDIRAADQRDRDVKPVLLQP